MQPSTLGLVVVWFCIGTASGVRRLQPHSAQSRGAKPRHPHPNPFNGFQGAMGGKLLWTVWNNSTLPLNVICAPKIKPLGVTLHTEVNNEMPPDGKFSFVPGMAAYDFRTNINDGENIWKNTKNTGWGFVKFGVGKFLGDLAGTGVGGVIAVTAQQLVAAGLSALMAPAVLAAPIAVVTLAGTGFLSQVVLGAVTGMTLEAIGGKVQEGMNKRDARKMPKFAHDEPGNEFLHFEDVVPEGTVRDTFTNIFPGVDTSRLVVKREHAEAYLLTEVGTFFDWALAMGLTRDFMFTGGFQRPAPLPDTDWSQTEFKPLFFGTIEKERRGLCDKSLVIKYDTKEGSSGEVFFHGDWDQVPVVEKEVPILYDDMETVCVKRYIAMCRQGALRETTLCRDLQSDAAEPEWKEVAKTDQGLARWWKNGLASVKMAKEDARHVSLKKGEKYLEMLTGKGPESSVELVKVTISVREQDILPADAAEM